jgi:hypothetical protein
MRLKRVPQRRVAGAHLVHREIALEIAAVGTEQLDTRLDIGPPGRLIADISAKMGGPGWRRLRPVAGAADQPYPAAFLNRPAALAT